MLSLTNYFFNLIRGPRHNERGQSDRCQRGSKYLDGDATLSVVCGHQSLVPIQGVVHCHFSRARVDAEGVKGINDIVRSDLFKVPLAGTISLITAYAIGVSIAIIVRGNYLMQAVGFGLGLTVGSISVIPWFIFKALKYISLKLPKRELMAASISGLLISTYLVYLHINDIIISNFWSDILRVIPHIVVSLIIYITVWYVLSPWFRELARASLAKVIKLFHIIEE